MNSIETYFLDFGLSWSSSKALPYFLSILLGLILVFLLKKIRFNKKWIKWAISLFVLLLPFSIYFAFYPIYEGDFSNQGIKPKSKIQFPSSKTLTVVVLPDCPYCHESIYFIEKLLKRNSNMEIEIWICGNQEDSFYNSNHSKKLKISRINEFERTLHLTQGIFPTYTISEKQKLVKRWTNQSFGVRSLDEIEAFFEVHK